MPRSFREFTQRCFNELANLRFQSRASYNHLMKLPLVPILLGDMSVHEFIVDLTVFSVWQFSHHYVNGLVGRKGFSPRNPRWSFGLGTCQWGWWNRAASVTRVA